MNPRVQSKVMKVVNVPMRLVLGLPWATPLGGRLMLAYIVGRKTGRIYRQPLSYAKSGDVLISPGGGNWKRNLRPDKSLRIRVRGRDVQVRPEIVDDPDEIERLLGVLNEANPRAAAFMPLPKDQDGRIERDGLLRAIGYGFRIVRWHPEQAGHASV